MQTFEEAQLEAIKTAVASEREEGQRLIDEQKALMKTSLEEERIQCLELIKSSIEEERLKSKVKLQYSNIFLSKFTFGFLSFPKNQYLPC